MVKDMDAGAEITSGRLKVSKEEVKVSYESLLIPGRKKNISLLDGKAAGLNKSLIKINSVFVEHSLFRPDVSAECLLYGGFVR